MINDSELENFKEETDRACKAVGGLKLREWIHRKGSGDDVSNYNCCCPLLARRQYLQLNNRALSNTQFWSFADGFDNEANRLNDPLPGHDFNSLGKEFRQKVLAGDYDAFPSPNGQEV